jgi:hypothetical protein
MYSDNGTNFHGADIELHKALSELDGDYIDQEFFKWRNEMICFSPAFANFGGTREQMIGSVKKIYIDVKEKVPKVETLRTFLKECESVINSQPRFS